MITITVPYRAVHKAASVLDRKSITITGEQFYKAYRGQVGDNMGITDYVVTFDTEEDATMFLLRWA
jgi:hypothetical protein